ncbi:hypothetical protein HK100_009697 [Physocladia obscura]|uniref:Nudix hydrolase domain-containing protein n=1 Tax=Physocladia obscura TaxID=109957 RepID=A0AAD5SM54_9FUNG|nr:hypothetical protein HK100_009697 [Physocladia obscura]
MTTPALITARVQNAVNVATPSLKNRGKLNKNFVYFEAPSRTMVRNSEEVLSDHSKTKYYTVAADMLVFNAPRSHILMIFRCPHNKLEGRKCANNVLDQSSFQYKGYLATPGGFFDPATDISQGEDGKQTPDFLRSAFRELDEECTNLLSSDSRVSFSPVSFITARLNNFRDIRWLTSTNYVPTLATQFATTLIGPNSFPRVVGSDDACGVAYWVDLKIINAVYEKHKQTFDLFNSQFDEDTFEKFVKNPAHFVLNEKTQLPRNKLKTENVAISSSALRRNESSGREDVLNFDPEDDYQFSDFAFDHVVNILEAKKFLDAAAEQE